MTEAEFLERIKLSQTRLYSVDINDRNIPNSDILFILINRLEKLNYSNWTKEDKLQSHIDIRTQLLLRIEIATVHYYQSIESTQHDIKYIWDITKKTGIL